VVSPAECADTVERAEQALPQIDQLSEREQYADAFAMSRQQAKTVHPERSVWKRIRPHSYSRTVTVGNHACGRDGVHRPGWGSIGRVDPFSEDYANRECDRPQRVPVEWRDNEKGGLRDGHRRSKFRHWGCV
jgi:hypothetical protein